MPEPIFDLNKRWSEAYPELGTEPVPTEPVHFARLFRVGA